MAAQSQRAGRARRARVYESVGEVQRRPAPQSLKDPGTRVTGCVALLHRFLGTLKQHTIQSSVHGEDDLNVEHLQLLLLLFHNLSERGRRSVLTLVTQAVTEVAQSREAQLKAVPLNLARLCLVFDYLLRHYSKAPLYLFEQVRWSFPPD